MFDWGRFLTNTLCLRTFVDPCWLEALLEKRLKELAWGIAALRSSSTERRQWKVDITCPGRRECGDPSFFSDAVFGGAVCRATPLSTVGYSQGDASGNQDFRIPDTVLCLNDLVSNIHERRSGNSSCDVVLVSVDESCATRACTAPCESDSTHDFCFWACDIGCNDSGFFAFSGIVPHKLPHRQA
jgi:hypothetical protein